jgi:L-fuculose-phosphate aldolase
MSDTFSLSKDELIQKEQLRMERELTGGSSSWSLKEKVALCCQILHAHGHDSGLAGQITARAESGNFITQQLGYGLDEVTVSNLLTVDEDLNVLTGAGMPNPANRFHAWIYRARPDVRCIIHTHPLYTSALSMLEEPLRVSHMDTCVLFEDIAFLPNWPGIPVGNDEGEMISSALNDKRALLLAHHGLVVVSGSVEEACVMAIQFERAAKLHMIASAVGEIREIDPKLGRQAHDWILQERRSVATFSYYARQAIKKDASCLL